MNLNNKRGVWKCYSSLTDGPIALSYPPLGLGLGLRWSFQLRFFMRRGGVRKGRGGGYKSAIAPKIPALSVFKSEFKLSKFPSLSWIVSKYNCNAISQGQLLEMANTIIEFLTILQVSCDYDLTIYTLVMALILRKNNKKTQKYWERKVSQCKIMSKVPLLKRREKELTK